MHQYCSCLDGYIVNSVKCGIIDGNKRVALQAASVLLQINGYYLVAPQYEVYNVTYSIAETSSDDFQGVIRNISTWLRGRSTTRLRPWNITYRIRPKR